MEQGPRPRVVPRVRRTSESGQAILEFLLVLPLLLLIGAAVWEYGRILEVQIIAANAAREGARYGTTHSTDGNATLTTEIQNRVIADMRFAYGNRLGTGATCTGGDVCFNQTASATNPDILVTFTPSTGGPGSTVSVQATVHVTIFAPFVPGLTDPSGKYTVSDLESMVLQ
ncbi:MAG TPA: TadE/TadG family type IV pilus assembly protein [Chloroflexota bacterium]|nr:TadE/TadG family type IV pilus assembly protein [Chloroflexota bacterium]